MEEQLDFVDALICAKCRLQDYDELSFNTCSHYLCKQIYDKINKIQAKGAPDARDQLC